MILLQLKSSQALDALRNIEEIQKRIFAKTGHRIRGHEIQMVTSVLSRTTLGERVRRIVDFCSRRDIDYLTYHCQIFHTGENIWDPHWTETIRASIRTAAGEAQAVHESLSMKARIIVVVHLTNYVPLSRLPITPEEKLGMHADTKREFLSLYAGTLGNKFSGCKFAVENSYPKYSRGYASTGPFHPKELDLPGRYGIGTVLDFAHYQLYSNYFKGGKGNQPGDLDRAIYGEIPDWNECIKILSSTLVQLHISNARGTSEAGEGLPLDEGEIDIVDVLEEVDRSVHRLVQGTVELSGGHLHSGKRQLESVLWLLRRVANKEILA